MSNVKISALPAVTTVVPGVDVLPLVSGGITTKATPQQVVNAGLLAPGAIGSGTASTGAFTTLSASSTVSGTGFSTYLLSPPAIGTTAPAAGKFTDLTSTGNTTIGDASTDTFTVYPQTISLINSTAITAASTKTLTLNAGGGSNGLVIDASNNVGIGTSSPVSRLDVVGGSIRVNEDSIGTKIITVRSDYAGLGPAINVTTSHPLLFLTANAERMRISSSGIVTMSAYGAGAATFSAAGVISSVSDETWKTKDGVPFDTDAMLKKLEPGYWYYNDEKKEIFGVDRQLGFYAQNVNAAIGPEAAPEPEEGKPWGYYDRSVLAVVVMSLQKALATIESLEARLQALEGAK